MKRLAKTYSVTTICDALEVSRAGYYAWLRHKPGKQEQKDIIIRREILKSHAAAPCYGVENIHADVRENVVCGHNRVRRLMREMGVCSQRKRRYKATTNSTHNLQVAPNLLKGLDITAPNQVWVGDITYIATDEGWLYLAIVKDRFTREVVGYATGDRITQALAEQALRQAITRYQPPEGLVHHSDRGVQYCAHDYQRLLNEHKMVPSMSRKGNPYDNAVAENPAFDSDRHIM